MMNERIRELAEQAGIGFWGNRIIIFDFSADSEEVIQKFAELIIQENIKVVQSRFMGDLNREDMEVKRCVEALQNHWK
jgi:RNA binding exosome subunit